MFYFLKPCITGKAEVGDLNMPTSAHQDVLQLQVPVKYQMNVIVIVRQSNKDPRRSSPVLDHHHATSTRHGWMLRDGGGPELD